MHVKFAPLPVHNQDRAKDFYTNNFDCKVVVDKPYGDDGWRWIELKFPRAETTLQFERRQDESPSEEPSLVLVHANIDEVIASLKSHGVDIITEPKTAPWDPDRRFAEFRDSEGNRVVIGTA